MSEEYTPTTDRVRNIYAGVREDEAEWDGELTDQTIFEAQDEFDRWLAEVERAAAARALEEAAEDHEKTIGEGSAGGAYLRARAAEIRGDHGID